MRETVLKALPALLAAVTLLFVGCNDQITSPNIEKAETSSEAVTNAGPKARGAKCDVTVKPGESIDDKVDNTAQSGDIVCVERGTYEEQVTINKDLTLKGLSNPTIQKSSDPDAFTIAESGPAWEPIVFAFGGTAKSGEVSGGGTVDVTVTGFTIDGRGEQPDARRLPAVLYRNANGTVSGNTVENMAIGGSETFGILAYGDSEVDIVGNDINGYERGGIGANGDGGAHPAPEVKIVNNEITGSTGIGEAWGPNGIQVGFGAEGQVYGNVVKDNRYSDSGPVAACVLVFESDNVSVKNNTISNCDIGLSVGTWGWFRKTADENQFVKNEISNTLFGVALEAVAEPYGGALTQMDPTLQNTKVVNNRLQQGGIGSANPSVGVWVVTEDNIENGYGPIAHNNKVIANQITGFDTSVDDGGAATKVQANDRPIAP